jgi:hypothetical protein
VALSRSKACLVGGGNIQIQSFDFLRKIELGMKILLQKFPSKSLYFDDNRDFTFIWLVTVLYNLKS